MLLATVASAVDVRQPDDGGVFAGKLVRAYAPCLTPTDTARNGMPACAPPLRSACTVDPQIVRIVPLMLSAQPPVFFAMFDPNGYGPSSCQTDPYVLTFAVRTTTAIEDGGSSPCTSPPCTLPDVERTLVNPLDLGGRFEPSVEILTGTITAPDGLPAAMFGMDGGVTAYRSNLTVPFVPCTAPEAGGACSAAAPVPTCDFTSGEIEWPSLVGYGMPTVHVTLRGLAGSSPVCTLGTYTLEATLRLTGTMCGTPSEPLFCTVVDQAVLVPLVAKSSRLDITVAIPFGNLGQGLDTWVKTVGVVSARILDPTGVPIAVPGLVGVEPLERVRATLKGDQLRVRAILPTEYGADPDPTRGDGLTVTLRDRDGVFYAVTIPPDRWEAQLPAGARYTYADPAAALGGVRQVSLKRNGKPSAVKGWKIDLRAVNVDLTAADFPGITVAVQVPRATYWHYDAEQHCTGTFKGTKLDCR